MEESIYYYLGYSSVYFFISFLIVHFILKKVVSKKTKMDKMEEILLIIGIGCLLYFIYR